MGDFNAVLGAHEKLGGPLPGKVSCDDFKQASDDCGLIHLPTDGAKYTWSNGRGVRKYV